MKYVFGPITKFTVTNDNPIDTVLPSNDDEEPDDADDDDGLIDIEDLDIVLTGSYTYTGKPYKTISGKKYYSGWSKSKAVTIKK